MIPVWKYIQSTPGQATGTLKIETPKTAVGVRLRKSPVEKYMIPHVADPETRSTSVRRHNNIGRIYSLSEYVPSWQPTNLHSPCWGWGKK